MTAPKITSALVCDDVRQEISGKQILIGVYNSDLRIQSVPVTLPLCVWTQIENLPTGESKFDFRGVLGGKEIIKGEIGIELTDGSVRACLPIGPLPIKIEEAGRLRFSLKFPTSKKWQTATEIDILLVKPIEASVES